MAILDDNGARMSLGEVSIRDVARETAIPLKAANALKSTFGRGPGEGHRLKNTLGRRPGEGLEQKRRLASAEAGPSSRSSHSGAGAGDAGIRKWQAGTAACPMEPSRTDGPLSALPPKVPLKRPFPVADCPEVPRKRPFAVRECPPGMRIRGARPMTDQRPRAAGDPGRPHANQKVVPEIRKVGSVPPTTSNSRPDSHMKRADTGPSHQGKAFLGASSTPSAPVPPKVRNTEFAPELRSKDPRVRVKFLLYEYDNLRRWFLAEDKRKGKQPGKISRPDLRASEELKPFRPFNESIYGKVPGVEVGDHYHYRMEMFMIALHRQSQGGIDFITESKSTFRKSAGQRVSVAVSVIASGGYEDDQDYGDTIIYTGAGGNIEKANKKASKDQELERGNLALKNSCDLKLAVRVVRGRDFKNTQGRKKGINNQSPSGSIYFYDGLYDVKECYQERGVSGCMVWRYKLVRQPDQGLLSEQLLLYKGTVLPPQLEARGERVLLEDIALGCEPVKIRVVGYENGDVPPSNFTYISSLRFGWTVPRPAALTTSGKWCTCSDTQCVDSSCSCDALNGEPAYNEEGSLLWAKRLVYECGPRCGCSSKCVNRVVQKGLCYDMEVFRTKQKGWGVRSKTFIPQGSFICEYVGEVIHTSEAEKLVEQDEYLFDLKIPDNMERRFGHESGLVRPHASESDDLEGKVDEPEAAKFTIDAKKYGNIARFINHSCNPNLFVQCVLYDHHDSLLPHIALFAQEHIAPYKELTYDYGYELNKVTHKNGEIKPKKCHCLAKDCRGRLY